MTLRRAQDDAPDRHNGGGKRSAVRPRLSVILVSVDSLASLERALEVLTPLCARIGAELVVARASAEDPTSFIHGLCPAARVIAAPPELTNWRLREVAMHHVQGDVISLRECTAVGDGSWLDAITNWVASFHHLEEHDGYPFVPAGRDAARRAVGVRQDAEGDGEPPVARVKRTAT